MRTHTHTHTHVHPAGTTRDIMHTHTHAHTRTHTNIHTHAHTHPRSHAHAHTHAAFTPTHPLSCWCSAVALMYIVCMFARVLLTIRGRDVDENVFGVDENGLGC